MTDQSETQGGIPAIKPDNPVVEYAGFWIRFLAFILDSILASMILIPILLYFYDLNDLLVPEDLGSTYYLISYGLPFLAFVLFWKYRSATPGKIWMDIYIVDADTLGKPSTGKLVLRYLGYYLSSILFMLGFIWIAFDARKQGLHDKIANTVVIKGKGQGKVGLEQASEREAVQPREEIRRYKSDPWKE